MYTNQFHAIDNYQRVTSSESSEAYEASLRFSRDFGGSDAKASVSDIRSFIYRIYPTFFLSGICYNKDFYVIDCDMVHVHTSLINHCPSSFSRMMVSMLVRLMASRNKWELTADDMASIVLTCAADFSDDYVSFFPYTVRIFTGSELKRVAYRSVFELQPIRFSVYEEDEPQADVDEVARSKLDNVIFGLQEDEIAIVDDTGLAMYCLGGNPGSNVKQFFEKMPPADFNKMIRCFNDNRGHVQIAIGATFKYKGQVEKILVEGHFPIRWETQLNVKSPTFDPYVSYKSQAGSYLSYDSPQKILIQWLWHRFKKILCAHWIDTVIKES